MLYTVRDEGVAFELFEEGDPSTVFDDLVLPAEPYEDSIAVVAGRFDEECRCTELLVVYQPWGEIPVRPLIMSSACCMCSRSTTSLTFW